MTTTTTTTTTHRSNMTAAEHNAEIRAPGSDLDLSLPVGRGFNGDKEQMSSRGYREEEVPTDVNRVVREGAVEGFSSESEPDESLFQLRGENAEDRAWLGMKREEGVMLLRRRNALNSGFEQITTTARDTIVNAPPQHELNERTPDSDASTASSNADTNPNANANAHANANANANSNANANANANANVSTSNGPEGKAAEQGPKPGKGPPSPAAAPKPPDRPAVSEFTTQTSSSTTSTTLTSSFSTSTTLTTSTSTSSEMATTSSSSTATSTSVSTTSSTAPSSTATTTATSTSTPSLSSMGLETSVSPLQKGPAASALPTHGLGPVSTTSSGISGKEIGIAVGVGLVAVVLVSLAVLGFVLRRRGRLCFWRNPKTSPKDEMTDRLDEDWEFPLAEKSVVSSQETTGANQSSPRMGVTVEITSGHRWSSLDPTSKPILPDLKAFVKRFRDRLKNEDPGTESTDSRRLKLENEQSDQGSTSHYGFDKHYIQSKSQATKRLSNTSLSVREKVSRSSTDPRPRPDSVGSITSCTTCRSTRAPSRISLESSSQRQSTEFPKPVENERASDGSGWSMWFNKEEAIKKAENS
ncbi:hypothetical protein BD289DRAFT_48014 [Coniella lustricola]|uniref:Uncharacterized protein n=1 Tax=Coniella lustricola TaxID=2025994 RepID=A0A2T3AIG4_9PEZI|nr:hypothetical protein BD289DRAFT_48014 [Coniella lustricola]